jgi:sulfatase maturation enzyme AslB (radical SAM superfamily)
MAPVQEMMLAEGCNLDESLDAVKGKIRVAAGNGYKQVVLTGGEVTLRDDFVDLVAYAVSLGLRVTVQTNGRRLSRQSVLDRLKNIENTQVEFVIAYHSDNAVVHDRITRRKGSHAQTMSAIKLLKVLDFEISGKIVLSLANYERLEDTLVSLEELGVHDVIVAFPHAEEFSPERFAQVVPTYTMISESLHEALQRARSLKMQVLCETIPFCSMRKEDWHANLDIFHSLQKVERLKPVIAMPGREDLIDWNFMRGKIKSKGHQCTSCLLDRLCEGPWQEYIEHFGFAEFSPIEDTDSIENFIMNL